MEIFVGSIPFKFTEKDLTELFSPFGQIISAQIIIDKSTRQNKGFGFIEMADDKSAEKAISALNGSEQMGRKINVSKANRTKSEGPEQKKEPKKKAKKKKIITWG